jgi:hypothetical protein
MPPGHPPPPLADLLFDLAAVRATKRVQCVTTHKTCCLCSQALPVLDLLDFGMIGENWSKKSSKRRILQHVTNVLLSSPSHFFTDLNFLPKSGMSSDFLPLCTAPCPPPPQPQLYYSQPRQSCSMRMLRPFVYKFTTRIRGVFTESSTFPDPSF